MYRFLILLTVLCLPAMANPLASLNKYGEGEMKAFFWSLYKAELYGTQETYSPNDKHLALKITYHRNIRKQALINATNEQWQHIGINHPQTEAWLTDLSTIWPDVKPGDTLIVKRNTDGTTTFFNTTNVLGSIQHPDFAEAFLSIWLSEKTSRPKLRQALLGHTQ
ncbi:chalcone isomerase family protein [Teredinibacter sp. KSP-S5-2]|uniref:chalcone isomerase family protein n=1 Tax=Teredinibacter sp. KSP-S5-2 TaxID=3034506 RepID=UPI00293511E9|nr:chalcone isomerase family protein [Teredinibacter sp. KSP-S5-2]WNO11246.1 chalcone isomerase family protein [Teredinibacter sp. KSP-S5-2]